MNGGRILKRSQARQIAYSPVRYFGNITVFTPEPDQLKNADEPHPAYLH